MKYSKKIATFVSFALIACGSPVSFSSQARTDSDSILGGEDAEKNNQEGGNKNHTPDTTKPDPDLDSNSAPEPKSISFATSPVTTYSYFAEVPSSIKLQLIVRDFQQAHPDFEAFSTGVRQGIVQSELDTDGKLVLKEEPGRSVTSAETLAQWFRDVEGVNQKMPITIQLSKNSSGVYEYSNSNFFPIDNQLYGNEGHSHNYHFTAELETKFTYQGGEVFNFTGDDDVFVFINNKLAVDLGGVHGAASGSVNLDAKAEQLGISIGNTYVFKMFFAERHLTQSNFKINTSIQLASNTAYSYKVGINNPDKRPLTFSLESNLPGLAINSNGELTMSNLQPPPGDYPVKIIAKDSLGQVIRQEFTLKVTQNSLY